MQTGDLKSIPSDRLVSITFCFAVLANNVFWLFKGQYPYALRKELLTIGQDLLDQVFEAL